MQALLNGRDGAEGLRILADGDRLGMRLRCGEWAGKRCHLVDSVALAYEVLAMVVVDAPTLDSSTDFDEWLEGTIEVAAEAYLDRDAELARQGVPVEEPIEPRFRFLMETLRFTPDQVRIATAAANALPVAERHVFHHCLVQGKGFGRYGREMGIDALHARDLLMRAVNKLCDAVGDE